MLRRYLRVEQRFGTPSWISDLHRNLETSDDPEPQMRVTNSSAGEGMMATIDSNERLAVVATLRLEC
jgi:hypothetical protein